MAPRAPPDVLMKLGVSSFAIATLCLATSARLGVAQTAPAPSTPPATPAPATVPAAAPAAPAAPLVWHPLVPDTIGRLIIRVDTAAKRLVRVSVDTVDGKTPIVTGALAADSVELWGKSLDSAAKDSLKAVVGKDYRLGEYAMMTLDSTASGRGYKLLVADTTGDQTFAVMIPFSYVSRITNSFARATRPRLPAPTPTPAATPPKSESPDRTNTGRKVPV